jgi:hypothetical protein
MVVNGCLEVEEVGDHGIVVGGGAATVVDSVLRSCTAVLASFVADIGTAPVMKQQMIRKSWQNRNVRPQQLLVLPLGRYFPRPRCVSRYARCLLQLTLCLLQPTMPLTMQLLQCL